MMFTSLFHILPYLRKDMTMHVLLVSCLITIIRITEVSAISSIKGSTIQLVCPYRVNGDATLQWSLISANTPRIYSNNDMIAPYLSLELRQRLSITGDHTKGEFHLNISNIMESDRGEYRCNIASTVPITIYELIVIVDPTDISFQNVTPDNRIPGTEGQDMTIKCTAVGGQPAPDIKLVILGSTYTGKQSAQHTFKTVSSNDGSRVTCQAGYEDINHYPLTTTAYIHLKLKPVITSFAPNTLSTEETKSFVVSCRSTGSRPAASMYWFLGQKRIDVTSNSTSQSNQESLTDKYTVTSNLRYRVDRRYNGRKLICRASNDAGYMETSVTLDVKYAPNITVDNQTFTHTQTSRQIQSTSDSNPLVNTCTWRHKSTYGENIREFSNNNQILTLPTVHEDQRYQDTGEYICTAENGIVGLNGQLKQTGYGHAISNGPPVITSDNRDSTTQYGKFGENTKVYVNVYSIPKYSSISWYIGNRQLVSNKYVTKEEPTIVKDIFHGAEVQLDGYRVTLTISELHEVDFTNYSLRIYYSSQYIGYEVILESSSGPETPSNFTITSSSENSITVQWVPGNEGGHTQSFYIQYRISGTNAWLPDHEIKTSKQLDLPNLYTLSGLIDTTTYELRMYAKNKFNQSQHTDIQTTKTLHSEAQTSSNAVIGSIVGVVIVLLIACAIIISILIFKKRKAGMKQTEKNAGLYENGGFQNVQNEDEYEEVVSKSDTNQKQTSKTYESLGTKNAVDVYDDLDNRKGFPSSKPPMDHYEALSSKDKPNVYVELENRQGKTEKVYVNEAF